MQDYDFGGYKQLQPDLRPRPKGGCSRPSVVPQNNRDFDPFFPPEQPEKSAQGEKKKKGVN